MIFNIKKNDVISIVGAGGKTALMFYLANNIMGKKIVSTSTQIFRPANYSVNLNKEIFFEKENEIIVTAKEQRKDKLAGINKHAINSQFDYYFIEADGSKRKKIKGWNESEPVIINQSNKTIGVIDITVINQLANEDLIFRIEEFKKITNIESRITVNNLIDVIINAKGLFKNSDNDLILYINKVEHKEDFENTLLLIKRLKEKTFYNKINQIVYGSLKNNDFYLYED